MRAQVLTIFVLSLLVTGGLAIGAFPSGETALPVSSSDAASPTGEPADSTASLDFRGGIVGTGSLSEPSIDISLDGRIFVTGIQGLPTRSPIFEYTAGSWVPRGISLHRAGEIGGGDADLEIDSAGRFYHSDLSLANDAIAVSNDGVTWIGAPVSHYLPVNDRQWFAHYGDQYLYQITNNVPLGLVSYRYEIGTPVGELGAFMAPLEVPVGTVPCYCGPPGFPTVDQNNGKLYIPIGASTSGITAPGILIGAQQLKVFRSDTNGLTFTSSFVTGAGDPVLFPVAAVDEASNLYVAWGEVKNGQYDIYLSVSKSRGLTWEGPFKVNSFTGTHVMPWLVAGEEGRVGVAWYGTDVIGNPNTMPASTDWRLYYAESLNAASGSPSFSQWDVLGTPTHRGSISTGGLTGASDRSLGDFMSMALNPVDGAAYMAFVNNHPNTPASQRGVWVERMPAAASALT